MKYEITTKQGNNYIVSDDSAWLWIELERELGYTVSQAADKMSQGSRAYQVTKSASLGNQ